MGFGKTSKTGKAGCMVTYIFGKTGKTGGHSFRDQNSIELWLKLESGLIILTLLPFDSGVIRMLCKQTRTL